MIHFDGANISGRRSYDVLTFCEMILGCPTGGLRSQVSGLRYQVSGIRSRVSGLRYGASTPPGLSIKGS